MYINLKIYTGALAGYIKEEMAVRDIEPCDDPLQFATIKAEPEFSVLGKRLGKSMGVVAKGIKNLSEAEILKFQKELKIQIEGFDLTVEDIKVFIPNRMYALNFFFLSISESRGYLIYFICPISTAELF